MTQPFTYLLYHKPTGYWYYGVRYAKNCQTTDIWTKYFSSSKSVKSLIEEYGKDSFEVIVRKVFDSPEDAIKWEQKVLVRMGAVSNPMCLNKNAGGAGWRKAPLTQHQKNKISTSLKQYIKENPKAVSKRASKAATNFWKNMTPEKRELLIQKRRDQINPMQGKRQRRVSCINCRSEVPINYWSRHKCKS